LLVLGPITSHIKILDSEIRAKSHSIQRDMRVVSFKKKILSEYQRFAQYLDTGEKSQEEIIGNLLRKLETLATQNNIKISNVKPGEIEEKPIYKVYKTSLDFEGTLAESFIFMDQLEEFDNLFQIDQYTLTPKTKAGTSLKCSMEISRILISAEDALSGAAESEEMDAAEEIPESDTEGVEVVEDESLGGPGLDAETREVAEGANHLREDDGVE